MLCIYPKDYLNMAHLAYYNRLANVTDIFYEGGKDLIEKVCIELNQSDKIDEMIDILAEFYEDLEDGDNEIWDEVDAIHEDMGGMAQHMMAIVKLQGRIAVLEKTVEFTRKDGM